MEKQLIRELGQENIKISVERLIKPGCKEMLQKYEVEGLRSKDWQL